MQRETEPLVRRTKRVRELEAEVARLRAIMDRPDPHNFMVAAEIEARFQLDHWGDQDGQPTAFAATSDADFYRLVQHLATKALLTTDEEGTDKKLHRITTVAAAACNWHIREMARQGVEPQRTPRRPAGAATPYPNRPWRWCRTCDGSGLYVLEEPRCPTCDGTGKVPA